MVDRLTNLVAIFENPALDFSKNRAEGDDILGDAYEYLMRHFATESGKSKGQFYTPAEVSRVIAQVIGIRNAKTSAATTVYDPTCGSGSLLLKVGDEAALVVQGNTLADPRFKDGDSLKTFDFVVANPPFSDKRWSHGIDPLHDPYDRFQPFGTPPARQGDYAYLLHIPGAVPQAIGDADTFFGTELPALSAWTFGAEQAAAISQPVLSVLGADTEPLWIEVADVLRSWLGQVEDCTIEGAGHLLHMQRPEPVAQCIGAFLGRHPLTGS
jgi:hypothetical protein